MFRFWCVAVLCAAASPVFAANSNGDFWDGGGIGRVKCTGLLNTLATVRQGGGFGDPSNVHLYVPYIMYIAGFQTAYDAMTPGIYDIFKGLGDDPDNVLIALEPYCAKYPTKLFNEALWELVNRLSLSPEVR